MAVVSVQARFATDPERVWGLLQRVDTLLHVAAPLVTFRPVTPAQFPREWRAGTWRVAMRAFGVLPLGRQDVVIEYPAQHPAAPAGARLLRDNGTGQLVRRWDHWVFVAPAADRGTAYTDRVEIEAGLLTPGVWLFAALFYRWRQHRWRALLLARRPGRQPSGPDGA